MKNDEKEMTAVEKFVIDGQMGGTMMILDSIYKANSVLNNRGYQNIVCSVSGGERQRSSGRNMFTPEQECEIHILRHRNRVSSDKRTPSVFRKEIRDHD